MAVYRYIAHDLRTGTRLGELPLGGVSYSEVLNGAGELIATIDLGGRSTPKRIPAPTADMFVEDPPGSGFYAYLGDPSDWVEDPPGSGLYEWVGS